MTERRSPNAMLAIAIAASGLLLAGLGRERTRPTHREARADATRQSAARPEAAARDLARPGGTSADAGRPREVPASDLPPRHWWQALKRTAIEVDEDRVLTEAAGVTFYALLAIFPAIGAGISIYGLFADPQSIEQHLSFAAGFIPGGGMEIISEQVHRIAAKPAETLGLGLILGLAISLWSANAGMKALFDALNVVYDAQEQRGFVWRTAIAMAFTLGAILLVVLALAAGVLLPAALEHLGLDMTLGWLDLVRWPLLLVGIGLFLALVYRYGPSRKTARWRWITWGSAVASLIWVAGSAAFSWYVSNFGSYNETYGSLGAAIGFMTWIWLSATVVLVGAELDSELEEQDDLHSGSAAHRSD